MNVQLETQAAQLAAIDQATQAPDDDLSSARPDVPASICKAVPLSQCSHVSMERTPLRHSTFGRAAQRWQRGSMTKARQGPSARTTEQG